jgi:tRNA 2-thiouridine synthesizing protein A
VIQSHCPILNRIIWICARGDFSRAALPVIYGGKMTSVVEANLFVDAKNMWCPIPIIKISQAIKSVEVGETVLMETTDPGSKFDVPAWARRTGHELLESGSKDSTFHFLVRRTR